MRSVLGDRTAVFDDGGRKLSITKDGISVEGKKEISWERNFPIASIAWTFPSPLI